MNFLLHDNIKAKILYTEDQPIDVTLTKDGHKVSVYTYTYCNTKIKIL